VQVGSATVLFTLVQERQTMQVGNNLHHPLARRVEELVAKRPFHDRPSLVWVTANHLDAASVDRIVHIAHVYGVRGLAFDGSYFR